LVQTKRWGQSQTSASQNLVELVLIRKLRVLALQGLELDSNILSSLHVVAYLPESEKPVSQKTLNIAPLFVVFGGRGGVTEVDISERATADLLAKLIAATNSEFSSGLSGGGRWGLIHG
jgi:hypothetical protein